MAGYFRKGAWIEEPVQSITQETIDRVVEEMSQRIDYLRLMRFEHRVQNASLKDRLVYLITGKL